MVKVEYVLYNKKVRKFGSTHTRYYENIEEYKRGYEKHFNAWLGLGSVMFITSIVEE